MGIGVSGLMSGLDTESILGKLMEIERRPITLLQSREAAFQAKISAVGTLKAALSEFRSTASALSDTDAFRAMKAVSGNEDVLAVSATNEAQAGTWQVRVDALAQAEQKRSAAFTGADVQVGTGTITIQVGSDPSVDIAIDTEHATLSGIAQAVNAADAGVTAAVVDDGNGNFYLTLSSQKTGAANTISFTIADDDGNNDNASGLSALYTDPAAHSLTVTQAARNAAITVNGIAVERADNTFDDLIQGVSMTLKKADTASTFTVTVTKDTDAAVKKVQAFVDGYNKLVDSLRKLTGYDADTKTAGALQGDSIARGIGSRLLSVMRGKVEGVADELNGLDRLGIEVDRNGKLSLDSSRFIQAIEEAPEDVSRYFGNDEEGNEGIALRVEGFLDGYLSGTDGVLASREKGLKASVEKIQDQVEAIETRLLKREENLRRQFEALEMLLSSYQSTSGQLSQQLASITNLNAQIANK
ncbi:MAG: flagellar filament capping protein FliD [Deltaproteobacteria bacterium]